jgi:replicative DNA helicase
MGPTAERRPGEGGAQNDARGDGNVTATVVHALGIARDLAAAGIPVFVAYPDPDKPGEYKPRKGWQNTTANPAYVGAWKPGLALCAVMGHGLDLVDIDPRNGGDLAALDGIMPDVLGAAESPSGGTHHFVRSMGVGTRDDLLPGIDVKAGAPDGQGRGFAFIAPTVRKSKVTGQPAAYRWTKPPDLARLRDDDPGGAQLAALVRHARGSRKQPSGSAAPFQQPASGWDRHAGPVKEGGHHGALVSYAGWMRKQGIPLRPQAETLMRARLADLVPGAAAIYTEDEALAELHDIYSRYEAGDPGEDAPAPGPGTLLSRLLPGGCILDVPALPGAIWGAGSDILWAAGQSLIIAGPDGVGKTTLAANLVQARLGLTKSVLGMPVTPGNKNILVLLMDRPQQAMAALARLFTEHDRDLLDERLRIWRGPPPQDLARNTTMLAQLCALADADTCMIDSLKDAALKLTEDEAGSGWNQGRQYAIEAGTELVELHHPRKGQDGNRKPSKLDDLYGSRWISAGAGSVVSLWGQAGDPVVELAHLKPAAETVGPWQVGIDAVTGTVSIAHGIDLIEQIRGRGANGITAAVAAKLLYGSEAPAATEKARRRLDRKVADGLLVRQNGHRGGNHGSDPASWFLAAITEPFTEQSRPRQAITPTQEPGQTRDGGDTNPPSRDWPAGTIGAEANE